MWNVYFMFGTSALPRSTRVSRILPVYTILFNLPITLSVARLLFSTTFQNDVGTSGPIMQGAVVLYTAKKCLRLALRSYNKLLLLASTNCGKNPVVRTSLE